MKKAEVIFLAGMTKEMEEHYIEKEYRQDVFVKIGELYFEVYFNTYSSLKNDMRKDGFCAFPGMIILDEMSDKLIVNAIKELINLKYFESFTGYKELPLTNRFIDKWYSTGDKWTTENMTSITLE